MKCALDVLGRPATFWCIKHFIYVQSVSGDGGRHVEFSIQQIGRERTRVGERKWVLKIAPESHILSLCK